MDASPVELEAVRLRFRHLHPVAGENDAPSAEEAQELLANVRERAAAIEAEMLKMLERATRHSPR